MATKRSSGPAKKAPRTKKKKATVDPVVETPAVVEIHAVVETPAVVAAQAATPEPLVTTPIDPRPVAAAPPVPVDEIRRRAYNYWVQGSPDPIANWFRAENELKRH